MRHHTYACERPSNINTFPAAFTILRVRGMASYLHQHPNIQHFTPASQVPTKVWEKQKKKRKRRRRHTNAKMPHEHEPMPSRKVIIIHISLCLSDSPRYDGDAQASRQCPEDSVWLCAVLHTPTNAACAIIIIILVWVRVCLCKGRTHR